MSEMRKKGLVAVCILIMLIAASAWASPEMVLVKAGSFQMGNPGEDGVYLYAKPVHLVKLTYDFEIGKYEITNEQFLEFLNDADVTSNGYLNEHPLLNTDSEYFEFQYKRGKFILIRNENTNYPVIEITWWGAIEFCNWLSEKKEMAKAYDSEGNLLDKHGNKTTDITQVEGYRLPTEAEWEYAARGGHKSIEDYKYAGSNDFEDVAWVRSNSVNKNNPIYNGQGTHEIGQKAPNELGLYDMSGNVGEWCHDYFIKYTSETRINPTGPDRSHFRMIRGGGWYSPGEWSAVFMRFSTEPESTHYNHGFRIARTRK
jgi:formylglycine-generating enzyme required for sulfatase activity